MPSEIADIKIESIRRPKPIASSVPITIAPPKIPKMEKIKKLDALAKERGQSLPQMALSWLLKDSDVTSVLIGASKPEQILDNLKMLDGAPLSEEELLKIDQICGIK